MIIKDKIGADFLIIGPVVDYCSLHEHNPSIYTQIRITTLCYSKEKKPSVVISTFSEGVWDTSEYFTNEVYQENYNKVIAFLGKKNQDTLY